MILPAEKGNYAYMLLCADGTFYSGWTTDLVQREKMHNAGKGAKYTRSRLPVRIVYYETFATPTEARSREWHMKQLSHKEKEALANEKALQSSFLGV